MLSSLSALDTFIAAGVPADWPPDMRTFWSPVDDVHGALVELATSASLSLVLAEFDFVDEDFAAVVHDKIGTPGVFVQLNLDASQDLNVHEQAILAKNDYPETSIALGNSEKGAYMHLKVIIVDGMYLATGSTNLSSSGETRQDNQLTITANSLACAQARARIDMIHDSMLKQMAKKAAKAALPITGPATGGLS
jgi:hypothetical protein